jgi:hypothetical protein
MFKDPTQKILANEHLSDTVDPRDYFISSLFQKEGEIIDPDKTHPWSMADKLAPILENSYGSIIGGETFDGSKNDLRWGIILAERTMDGGGTSVYLDSLDQNSRSVISTVVNITIRKFMPFLSDEQRHVFIKDMIKEMPSWKDKGQAEVLSEIALKILALLPDHAGAKELEALPELRSSQNLPSPEQGKQLLEYFRAIAKKVDAAELQVYLDKMQQNLRWTDNAFTSIYYNIFEEACTWVLEHSPAVSRNQDLYKRLEVRTYPLQGMVTNPVTSQEQLADIISQLPFEDIETIHNAIRSIPLSPARAEIIELEKVVGCVSDSLGWGLSRSEGRGIINIFKLAQKIQEGANDIVTGEGAYPIKVIEHEGKYYISGDGRHRTVALKALGVARVPMLVQHIIKGK